MKRMKFEEAVESVIEQAMEVDPNVVIIGEDVHLIRRNLFVRHGKDRVRAAPISESAFLAAGISAAMAGLRPIVELLMVDFIGVAMDAIFNHAAKIKIFSGGKWNAPLVIRAPCGGGYGDGGQHGQCLWGWLAHIPGLTVVVPSSPADAGGLMAAALESEEPVIFLEHKLLSTEWLDFLGEGGRDTVSFDIPENGAQGEVPEEWRPVPFGEARIWRKGPDLTMISLGVGVHRCLEASDELERSGIYTTVLDLRTVSPLDEQTIIEQVSKTKRMLVVDEDYQRFGLSGEVAAIALESGIHVQYARVCTPETIPYSRELEMKALPNTQRIIDAARLLMEE